MQKRVLALEMSLDSSRLAVKELAATAEFLAYRQQETLDSQAFRAQPTQQLPRQPLPPELVG
jgi:hypothetical protein